MIEFKLGNDLNIETDEVENVKLLIISPKNRTEKVPGVLWIHGGGYMSGMKELVLFSRGFDIAKNHGAVVVSVGYRLSTLNPYPAGINDCYKALIYLKHNADRLGIRDDQIFVGGESAGGGLVAALCMLARDRKEVNIAYQMPLYPMLDNFDTESSRDNHCKVWNTKLNHIGWFLYLRKNYNKEVSPYASPSRQTNYKGLPPAYTFVCDAEPFLDEAKTYIKELKNAGVEAKIEIYHADRHSFDLLTPWKKVSKRAIRNFNMAFAYAKKTYFAKQSKKKEDL